MNIRAAGLKKIALARLAAIGDPCKEYAIFLVINECFAEVDALFHRALALQPQRPDTHLKYA